MDTKSQLISSGENISALPFSFLFLILQKMVVYLCLSILDKPCFCPNRHSFSFCNGALDQPSFFALKPKLAHFSFGEYTYVVLPMSAKFAWSGMMTSSKYLSCRYLTKSSSFRNVICTTASKSENGAKFGSGKNSRIPALVSGLMCVYMKLLRVFCFLSKHVTREPEMIASRKRRSGLTWVYSTMPYSSIRSAHITAWTLCM